MVISEMVYVLGNLYLVEVPEIARMVDDLLYSSGVRPLDEVTWARVLELWPDGFSDFADGVLAAVTLEKRYDAVATFDQRFIQQLRRKELKSYWDDEEAEDPDAEHSSESEPTVSTEPSSEPRPP